MAEQLLDRILREVRERLDASRAATEEATRLEAAVAALDERRNPDSTNARTPVRRPRRPRASSSKRAPRGENLRRIRDAIDQRPGATAGEVASATGIGRATAAATLGKLARNGELEKTELPGGGVGYRQAKEREAVADAAAGAAGAAASSGGVGPRG